MSMEITGDHHAIRKIKDICHIEYGTLQGEIKVIRWRRNLVNIFNDMKEAESYSHL